jgi:hypothetical protein
MADDNAMMNSGFVIRACFGFRHSDFVISF